MTSPSPDCGSKVKAFPTLQYTGTDSNLRLTVDSLIPCLGGGMAFYGLPAHGVVMDGTLGDMCHAGPQFRLKVTPGFGEVLPYFYIDGWNIKLPHGLNEWSYVDTGWFGYYSDWITAAGMKALYNHDPLALTTRLGTP